MCRVGVTKPRLTFVSGFQTRVDKGLWTGVAVPSRGEEASRGLVQRGLPPERATEASGTPGGTPGPQGEARPTPRPEGPLGQRAPWGARDMSLEATQTGGPLTARGGDTRLASAPANPRGKQRAWASRRPHGAASVAGAEGAGEWT